MRLSPVEILDTRLGSRRRRGEWPCTPVPSSVPKLGLDGDIRIECEEPPREEDRPPAQSGSKAGMLRLFPERDIEGCGGRLDALPPLPLLYDNGGMP